MRIKVIGWLLILILALNFKSSNTETQPAWYGPLIVTNEEALTLPDHPLIQARGCKVVALLSFNFDDGYESSFTKALPIFKEYELYATIFVTTSYIGQSGYLSLSQLRSLALEGWEIASRGLTHRDLTSLPPSEAEAEIEGSKKILESWGFKVFGFASPSNRYNLYLLELIKKYYLYHRTGTVGVNPLPLKDSGLGSRWELYYIEVHNETRPEEIMRLIDQVNQQGGWAIITFHRIDEEGRWSYSSEKLEEILRYARSVLRLCTWDEFQKGGCLPREG